MKILCVIPARYRSTRFPGKPLVDICGKPMIWWVYQQCLKVKDFSDVCIATDSKEIFSVCKKLKMKAVMTDANHVTGTDRIGEVARKIKADLYVNVQGDEPLLEPKVIQAAIKPFYKDSHLEITNLMTKIYNPVDVTNFTIPKVITNKDGIALYLTRSPAPYPKGKINFNYYKQVCVYGFKPKALKFYCDYGKKYGKAKNEAIEDIEILRFIENGYKVKFIEVESNTIAVDTPNDLEKVREYVKRRKTR